MHQQKRKETKLKEVQSALKKKYDETDQKYQTQNKKLTDEYRRFIHLDLQNQQRHIKTCKRKPNTF